MGLAETPGCFALDRRCAEDDDGPDQLISSLLRPVELELELVPIVG